MIGGWAIHSFIIYLFSRLRFAKQSPDTTKFLEDIISVCKHIRVASLSNPSDFFNEVNRGGLNLSVRGLLVIFHLAHCSFRKIVNEKATLGPRRRHIFHDIEHLLLDPGLSGSLRAKFLSLCTDMNPRPTDDVHNFCFNKLILKWLHAREKEFLKVSKEHTALRRMLVQFLFVPSWRWLVHQHL